jgi:hypothetical protein
VPGSQSPTDVVKATYEAVIAQDLELARTHWSDDATWHGVYAVDSPWAGDRTADGYLASLVTWFVQHPDYSADALNQLAVPPNLVVWHLRTRNGEAPHEVEGLMLWRVLNNKITDCWAIPGDQTSGLAL